MGQEWNAGKCPRCHTEIRWTERGHQGTPKNLLGRETVPDSRPYGCQSRMVREEMVSTQRGGVLGEGKQAREAGSGHRGSRSLYEDLGIFCLERI